MLSPSMIQPILALHSTLISEVRGARGEKDEKCKRLKGMGRWEDEGREK